MSRGIKLKIVPGTEFGRLTVVEETEVKVTPKSKQRRFLCRCICDKEVIVYLSNLRRGTTQSCGCLQIEISTKHGLKKHSLYQRCVDAIGRCHNPRFANFKHYGGRGIEVFEPWRTDISEFIQYIKQLPGADDPSLTLDRIDNEGNYEPGNLRFASWSQQHRNKRTWGKIPFAGVSQQRNKFRAMIRTENKDVILGIFDTPEEASEAYQKALHEILASETK